jgi:hypothetical protein
MPILTQPTPASQRRPWLWVVFGVPGVVLALLVGLVAWSWGRPVKIGVGRRFIALDHSGTASGSGVRTVRAFLRRPSAWVRTLRLPEIAGGGSYQIIVDWK